MDSTPVVTPLIQLFHSRRFIVALCTLAAGLLVTAIPSLLPIRDVILVLMTTLALAVIGGYSVSDASANARDVATQPVVDPSTTLKDLLGQLIDAGLFPQQSQLASVQALSADQIKLDHYIDPTGNIVSIPTGGVVQAIVPTAFHGDGTPKAYGLQPVEKLPSPSKDAPVSA